VIVLLCSVSITDLPKAIFHKLKIAVSSFGRTAISARSSPSCAGSSTSANHVGHVLCRDRSVDLTHVDGSPVKDNIIPLNNSVDRISAWSHSGVRSSLQHSPPHHGCAERSPANNELRNSEEANAYHIILQSARVPSHPTRHTLDTQVPNRPNKPTVPT
jgi:hypothetical protein